MPKYIFYLNNGKSIVLTDNSNDLDDKKIKYFSNFLSSNKVGEFNTDTDILLIKPIDVIALQISLNNEVDNKNYKHTKYVENIEESSDDDTLDELNLNLENIKNLGKIDDDDLDLGLLDSFKNIKEDIVSDDEDIENNYVKELKEEKQEKKERITVIKEPLSTEEWIRKSMSEASNTILDKGRDGTTVFDLDKDIDPNDDLRGLI